MEFAGEENLRRRRPGWRGGRRTGAGLEQLARGHQVAAERGPLRDPLLLDEQPRDGHHQPCGHREDGADGVEAEAALEGAVVLLRVHPEANEQDRRHLPHRARHVRRRLRAPPLVAVGWHERLTIMSLRGT